MSKDIQRAEHYLELWARWMRTSGLRSLWYRSHSACGAMTLAGQDFDEMADSAEHSAAITTDAVVRGLVPVESAAVHRRYLHAVYRFPREGYEVILSRAMENVGKGLHKKGMP